MKLVSFVLPVMDEEKLLPELHRRLQTVATKLSDRYRFEMIYVNDGSTDGSHKILSALQKQDQRIGIVDFSRNFGHQIAITAGLDHARGNAVITMDSDLQDPPEVTADLIAKWEEGFEVVYAQRRSRQDGMIKRFLAYCFYRFFDAISQIKIPEDTGDFRLLDRRVVDAIKQHQEHHRFLRGLSIFVGFRQIGILFDRDARRAGVTKYSFFKSLKLSLDALIGFSTVPLKLINIAGWIFFIIGLAGLAYHLATWIMSGWPQESRLEILTFFIAFCCGVQLLALGLVGTYVGRSYEEVKRRPLYLVSSYVPPDFDNPNPTRIADSSRNSSPSA